MLILKEMPRRPYLAVSVCYKFDLANLIEFIEYHRLVGVQKIYLCNNEDDPYYGLITDRALKPYVENGFVLNLKTYNMFPRVRNKQAAAHNFVIQFAKRDQVKWLAMLDMDEFLFPVSTNTLPELLMTYEDCACLQINYACFGSSRHQFRQKLQTDSYIWRAQDNWHWNHLSKPIAQVERISHCEFHHHYKMFGACWQDEDKIPCDFFKQPKMKHLRINHYLCRSTQDYEDKMKRGNPLGEKRDWKWFQWADRNEIYDDSMRRRFVPKLLEALNGNRSWYLSRGMAKLL